MANSNNDNNNQRLFPQSKGQRPDLPDVNENLQAIMHISYIDKGNLEKNLDTARTLSQFLDIKTMPAERQQIALTIQQCLQDTRPNRPRNLHKLNMACKQWRATTEYEKLFGQSVVDRYQQTTNEAPDNKQSDQAGQYVQFSSATDPVPDPPRDQYVQFSSVTKTAPDSGASEYVNFSQITENKSGHFFNLFLEQNNFTDGQTPPDIDTRMKDFFSENEQQQAAEAGFNLPDSYSETDGKSPAKRQAEFIYNQIDRALQEGRKIAVLYPTTNDQAQNLHAGHAENTTPSIQGPNQSETFAELSRLIRFNQASDAVHIVPISAVENDQSSENVNRDLHAVYEHLETGFDVIAMQHTQENGQPSYTLHGDAKHDVYASEILTQFATAYGTEATADANASKAKLIETLSEPYASLNNALVDLLPQRMAHSGHSHWRQNLEQAQQLAETANRQSLSAEHQALCDVICDLDPNNPESVKNFSNTLASKPTATQSLFQQVNVEALKQPATKSSGSGQAVGLGFEFAKSPAVDKSPDKQVAPAASQQSTFKKMRNAMRHILEKIKRTKHDRQKTEPEDQQPNKPGPK